MKVIHINTFDTRGGAARAAYRIHTALKKYVDSEMLVSVKDSNDNSVNLFKILFLAQKKWLSKRIKIVLQENIKNYYYSFNLFNSGIYKVINRSDADIVHLHWIGNEIISIPEIKKIKKPIVWTLHDMWAFCGAEHYNDIDHAGQYQSGYIEKKIDINKIIWNYKKKYWQNVNFNFVSPSYWLSECLQGSALFYQKKAKIIRNCLDIDQYHKIEKKIARKKINLSLEKKVILFGADGKDTNPLKGFQLLEDSFSFLTGHDIQFVVFGGKTACCNKMINGVDVIETGKINDDDYLVTLYNTADVFIISSMIDNYPNTVLEAMSCGTPCVGFKVGGIPEMIDHKVNGYLVDPFDTKQLAEGIEWVLHDEERRSELGKNARRKIEKKCNETLIAEEYKMLYESILKNR